MITITTDATYPLPSDNVALTVSSDDPSANWIRLDVTSAPAGSLYRKLLDESPKTQLPVSGPEGWDLADPRQHKLTLEVGGVYSFTGYEITRGGVAYGGGYAGDPLGFPAETTLGSNSITVEIGTRMTSPIGTSQYGRAVLVVWIWGDNIRATTKATHGEDTPAIVEAQGQGAQLAAEDSAVETALAAIDGYDITTLATELTTLCTALRNTCSGHFTNTAGGVHNASDTDNSAVLDNLPTAPSTPDGWAQVAQLAHLHLRLHMTNSAIEDGWGVRRFHASSGGDEAEPDTDNLPALAGAGFTPARMELVLAALGDAHGAYEAHRQDTTSHGIADGTNALPALGVYLQLHGTFLARSAALSAGPSTVGSGVRAAINAAGLTPTP